MDKKQSQHILDFDSIIRDRGLLAGSLPGNVQVDVGSLNRRVSVITDQQVRLKDGVWNTILDCVNENCQVRIHYREPGAIEASYRVLEPYSLVAFRGCWYVVANRPLFGQIDSYVLSRMEDPVKTKTTFSLPEDYRLEDYVDPEWGVCCGEESYDFVLTFSPPVASYIQERCWHREQRLEEKNDGSLTLSFSAGQLDSIGKWVMGWGADVYVASPPELISRIKEAASRVGAMYG